MPVKTVSGPESLAELARRLSDLSCPDIASHELERWLVASQDRLGEAETMYRAANTWRRQKGVDRLLRWKPPTVLSQFYPGGFAGFDRDSCPVWIIPFGGADMRGMLACVSIEEFMDFTLKIVECSMLLMRKKSQELGAPVTQHVFIFDLQGFSLKEATHGPTLEILQRLISVYEAFYPETLKAAYVLNASSFFQIVFKIVQSTVQQKTLAKIKVCGHEGWKDVKPLIDILPTQWGGTGAHGYTVCMGGQVPQEYLDHAQPEEIPGMGEICLVKIEAGSMISLPQKVTKDCDLRWKFRSEGGDLGFGVQRKKSEEDSPSTVLAFNRVQSHKEVQCGVMSVRAGFTYFLCLDNTFSKFRAKTVNYSVIMEYEEPNTELSVDDIVRLSREGMETCDGNVIEKKNKKINSIKKGRNSQRKKKYAF